MAAYIANHNRESLTIAIALFGDEISPRFDCCSEIAFVCEHADFSTAERIAMKGADSEIRLHRIMSRQCRILLCGGIRKRDLWYMEAGGIRVVHGLSGYASDRLRELDMLLLRKKEAPAEHGNCRRKRCSHISP